MLVDNQIEGLALHPTTIHKSSDVEESLFCKIPLPEFEDLYTQLKAHALAADHIIEDEGQITIGGGHDIAKPFQPSSFLLEFWEAVAIVFKHVRNEKLQHLINIDNNEEGVYEDAIKNKKPTIQRKVENVLFSQSFQQLTELTILVKSKLLKLNQSESASFWLAVSLTLPLFRARAFIGEVIAKAVAIAADIEAKEAAERYQVALAKLKEVTSIGKASEDIDALVIDEKQGAIQQSCGFSPKLLARTPVQWESMCAEEGIFDVDDIVSQRVLASKFKAERFEDAPSHLSEVRQYLPQCIPRNELPIHAKVVSTAEAECRRRARKFASLEIARERRQRDRLAAKARELSLQRQKETDAIFDAFISREQRMDSTDLEELGRIEELGQVKGETVEEGGGSMAEISAESYFKYVKELGENYDEGGLISALAEREKTVSLPVASSSQSRMSMLMTSCATEKNDTSKNGNLKKRKNWGVSGAETFDMEKGGLGGLLGSRHRMTDTTGSLSMLRTGVSVSALKLSTEGRRDLDALTPAELEVRFRPRKPRYFNRVKMGFEWNKYNQTHYDYDNPPPKTVQGYKFNLFYPDLLDPTCMPGYRLERSSDGNEDALVLRFFAGPPYEDVAFKIVNKEWDRRNGFLCKFEKGIMQLHFLLRRATYKK